MRKLITIMLLTLIPRLALGQGVPDVLDLGTELNAVSLNGAASTLTVTVGPTEQKPYGPTYNVAAFSRIVFDVYFDYDSNAGAISMTCTGGSTAATATRSLTSCDEADGNCTVNMGGVATTASLSADTGWIISMGTSHTQVIKCVFAHGGTPGADETLTVKVWLVK